MTPQGNQSESNTSSLDSHISDKQDSKALLGLQLLLRLLLGYDHCCDSCTELEMKGYIVIEGQSTQGSDK